MLTEQEEFQDFWSFLLDKASANDAYWLDSWLERNLEEYVNIEPCPQCQSRHREKVDTYNKTGDYVLATTVKCHECQYVISVTDKRDHIKELIARGDVKMKDVEILRDEVYDE